MKFTKTIIALACSLAFAQAHAVSFGVGQSTATESMRTQVQNEVQTPPKAPATARKAEELALDFIGRAVDNGCLEAGAGWNDEQETFVAIGVSSFQVNDINDTEEIAKNRTFAFMNATLNAKKTTIEFIRTELDASQVLTLPDTGLESQYDTQVKEATKALQHAMDAYQEALAQISPTREAELSQLSFIDYVKTGTKAVINKIDSKINFSELEKEKRARLQQLKDNIAIAEKKVEEAKKLVKQLQGKVKGTSTSTIKTFASMTLSGQMTVTQFESLINGVYQVAVIQTWSPKQERFVRAMLGLDTLPESTQQNGALTVGQFIRKNDWVTAVGTRRYLDKKGVMHILSVGAWPAGNGGTSDDVALGQAKSEALASLAFALQGDVVAKTLAQKKMQTLNAGKGKETTQTVDSFSKEVSQSLSIPTQGFSEQPLGNKLHPLLNRELTLVMLDYSLKNATAAKRAEISQNRTAQLIDTENSRSRGFKQGLDEAQARNRVDQTSYSEGRSDGASTRAYDKSSQSDVVYSTKGTQTKQENSSGPAREGSVNGGAPAGGFTF